MSSAVSAPPGHARAAAPQSNFRHRAARALRGAIEVVVLVAVVASPWAFRAVEPPAELALYGAVALLLVLWGARMLVEGEFCWQHCPVALCIGGLFLLGIAQSTPLPREAIAWLSPGTARLYDELLPAQQEKTIGAEDEPGTPGSTLSLYPAATRRAALRLLATFLVFAVVRNNCVSSASLRRLCIVALLNGAVLSVFAIMQQLSSPKNMLYWSFKSEGSVFGPFICRNHFPFYVNVCFGLGLGLLLSLRVNNGRGPVDRHGPPLQRLVEAVRNLLYHPLAPWVALAVALCLAGTLFSLSRGGFLGLLGASLVCLALRFRTAGRAGLLSPQAGAVLLGGALALLVVLWIGYDQITTRLESLWSSEALEQSRLPVWQRGLAAVPDFPILGSGYGTFRYVEELRRTDANEALLIYDTAHNDYLEALVEGGVLRLGLSLAAIVLLWRFGRRGLRRYRGTWRESLVWGALFAFCTVAIHSVGDFGLHLPAIVLLTTVLAAQLCGAGDPARTPSDKGAADDPDRAPLRASGFVPYAAAGVLIALGLVLCGSGWSTFVTHQLREAASDLKEHTDLESLVRQTEYLDAAATLNPDFAHLGVQRAAAHSRFYDAIIKEVRQFEQLGQLAHLLANQGSNPGLPTLASLLLLSEAQRAGSETVEKTTALVHLVPAVRAYIRARNDCPLLEEPHRALARYHYLLEKADDRAAYLKRAKFLAPGVPLVWYECGLEEMDDQPAQAIASWRRCLELSDKQLPLILDECRRRFKPEELPRKLDELLPDNAGELLETVRLLYRDDEFEEERKPLLDRALRVLGQQTTPLGAYDLVIKARVYSLLDRKEEAIAAFRESLNLEPRWVQVRLEFAHYLYDHERYAEARRELNDVLAQQHRNSEALHLLNEVSSKLPARPN